MYGQTAAKQNKLDVASVAVFPLLRAGENDFEHLGIGVMQGLRFVHLSVVP